jgi:hypothetical protein
MDLSPVESEVQHDQEVLIGKCFTCIWMQRRKRSGAYVCDEGYDPSPVINGIVICDMYHGRRHADGTH